MGDEVAVEGVALIAGRARGRAPLRTGWRVMAGVEEAVAGVASVAADAEETTVVEGGTMTDMMCQAAGAFPAVLGLLADSSLTSLPGHTAPQVMVCKVRELSGSPCKSHCGVRHPAQA